MRARLSDDIRVSGAQSLFQRIGPNRFGLREWDIGEYHARPFQKNISNEITVCVPGTIQQELGFGGVGYSAAPEALLKYLASSKNWVYLDRPTAETTTKYKQLIAYVWLETVDGQVLSYTRGKYSSAHRTLLLGRRSVGFGGHVLRQDAETLFGASDGGLQQAAVREISEELKASLPLELQPSGIIWDDSSFEGQKHIGFVLRGTLPHSSGIHKRGKELSIKQVQLLTKRQLWDAYHAMEFWSQLLIRQFAGDARPDVVSTIVPPVPPRRLGHIILVGEIANGKTSIAEALAQERGYRVVSASTILRKILGLGEMEEQRRLEFQAIALEFISTEDGPARLAHAIAKEISRNKGKDTVIDGIRQLRTLTALREVVPDTTVIYIDSPRDMACANYQSRVPQASILQFSAVREHEVEGELPLFRYEADAILNNADDLAKTIRVLLEWLNSK